MIGNTVANYRILDRLGMGGMGEVFLAHDAHLNRKVALKFLRKDLNKDSTARKRLLHEARSAAILDHPFICKIYQAVESDEYDFIVMEYLEGETLREALRRAPLPPSEVLRIAIEIAEALEVAHEHGVVHRDLKPANIMLGRGGHIKVMDFGLAKQPSLSGSSEDETAAATARTEPGAIVGTLEYMSPEQLRGKNIDGRSDIFSLGITLCEALTGKNPLHRPSAADTIGEIMSTNPVSLPSIPEAVPSIPGTILLKMVEKDPKNRYQSVKDVLMDLRLVQSGSISVGQFLRPRPKLKWLALAGMALVAAVALILLLWYMAAPSKPVLAFQERDWIVTTDFENQTGESIFDKSLDTALRVSLEQSSFVNLLPRSRIEQTLRRMKKTEVSRIDEPLAREIAQREGINVLLIPAITGIAGTYMISTTLEDAGSGAQITSESVRVRGKEEVLGALDQLTRNTRRSLGEKSSVISMRAKPLAKVTTPSLEALKQFSLGIEAHIAGKFEQARTYYENALALDPHFALAAASLGNLNFEMFDTAKGKKFLSRAVQMADNVTDREKYGILAAYARVVENDIPKAIQQWKVLSGMYPDDSAVHNNLGWYYGQIGKFPEAIQEYKQALHIDPSFMLSYNGLTIIYLYRTGQATSAIDLCLKEIAVDERSFWTQSYLGWAYLGTGDLERARGALEKSLQFSEDPNAEVKGVGNPYKNNLYRLAHVFRLQNKYAEAVRILQRIPEKFVDPEVDYEIGVVYQLMQDHASARNYFGKFRKFLIEKTIRANPKDPYAYIELALVSQRMGLLEEARSAFRKAAGLDPEQHFEFAQFYSIAGSTEEALRELELAVQKGWTNFIWMKIHPDLQNLYPDPRFQVLLKKHLK